ncbi:MAG: YHS domain-containing (seleno)protein [bacterium]
MRGLKRSLTIVLASVTAAAALAAGDAATVRPDMETRAEPAVKPEIYLKPAGAGSEGWIYALNGYDPVSYFTEGGPRQGSDLFTWEWKGALWRFADRDNMNRFIQRPQVFAPQYGGYCAWAMAHGRTAPGDPEAWAIHNGKLYVTLNRAIKRKWDRNRDGLIARADAHWPGVLEK